MLETLFYSMSCSGKAYKREFLLKNHLEFSEEIFYTEDHLFLMRVYHKATSCFVTNKITLFYRMGRENASNTKWVFSHTTDCLFAQKEIKKFIKYGTEVYYKRYLQYEFKKIFIDRGVLKQNTKILKQMVKTTKELLETIPKEYREKYLPEEYKFSDLSEEGVYKEFLKIRKYDKLKKYKKRANNILKIFKKIIYLPLKKIFDFFNTYLYRKAKRKFYIKLFYYLFSLMPLKDQVAIVLHPSRKLSNLQSIIDELSVNKVKFKVLDSNNTFIEDLKLMRHIAKSKVIVIDDHCLYLKNLTTRKNQIVIQVWHAAGLFKKFGASRFAKNSHEYNNQLKEHKSYTYAFVSSKRAIYGYMDAFNLQENQIIEIGNLAADKLINNCMSINQAKEILNIDPNKKLILYAPTFRDNPTSFKIEQIVDEINNKFNDYVLALRLHPYVSEHATLPDDVFNFSSIPEYLALNAADCLISDYSSIIFSYSYFGRPIIFYAPDYPHYVGMRNFYEDYLEFTSGSVAFNKDQLFKMLENIEEFSEKSKKIWNDYMSACDGNTAKKIVNFITTKCL